jgi:hypothetical protein
MWAGHYMINISFSTRISWWTFNKRMKPYQRLVRDEARDDGKINSYSTYAYRLKDDTAGPEITQEIRLLNIALYNKQIMDII